MTLLELDDLHVSFRTSRGDLHALDGVSFAVNDGESVGIVGDPVAAKQPRTRDLRILPNNAASRGRILFRRRDLLTMSLDEMRQVAGAG
jgi:ABC-type microcin C transport system duplicated ATPase subunit YejF